MADNFKTEGFLEVTCIHIPCPFPHLKHAICLRFCYKSLIANDVTYRITNRVFSNGLSDISKKLCYGRRTARRARRG